MIVLCSHIETGIGLIAPSLPHLRRLVMLQKAKARQDAPRPPPSTDDIVTIGRLPRSRTYRLALGFFRNPTDVGINLTTIQAKAEGSQAWKSTRGDASDDGELLERHDGKGIRTDYSYAVEFEPESDKESSHLEGRNSVERR